MEKTTVYDLEERTFIFAKEVRSFVKTLPKTNANREDAKQLIRASGSVAANYIEANEGLSPKDFLYRVKLCRKEVKECRLFLRLLDLGQIEELDSLMIKLMQECTELMRIFGAIITKTENPNHN
jgi:four helix bundle protein